MLNIPLGYRMVKKIKTVDIWEAEKILNSREQRYYTEAIRKDFNADLVGNYVICPYCNSSFAANNKCSLFRNHWYIYNERISKDKVRAWSDRQLTLFDDDKDKILYISSPIEKLTTFKCPNCNRESALAEKFRSVEIFIHNKKVTIKSEIVSFDEIFALKWNDEESISVKFPMYEIVVFDFEKGRIYAKLDNNENEEIEPKDITNCPEKLDYGAVYNAITLNKLVNRTIKRMFYKVWGDKLPYNGKEITIENLFKMTIFVGYNAEFYDYIPYRLKSYDIDDSFKDITKRLHDINDVEKIYVNSALPNVKSVRKIFFERTGLFFYLEEAEKIFALINDLNVYCKLLKSKCIFGILSDLHMRPGLIEYLKDYTFEKGPKNLVKVIMEDWNDIREAAIDYNCMSEAGKKAMREGWKNKVAIGRIVQRKSLYSIPMNHPKKIIPDCCIDGYKFFWLRNSNDYVIAGAKLKNCLGTWRVDSFPVVCVKKNEKYVAAIEVSDEGIVQAQGYKNNDIQSDRNLYTAFEKWMKRYNLAWDACAYDFYDEDDE